MVPMLEDLQTGTAVCSGGRWSNYVAKCLKQVGKDVSFDLHVWVHDNTSTLQDAQESVLLAYFSEFNGLW